MKHFDAVWLENSRFSLREKTSFRGAKGVYPVRECSTALPKGAIDGGVPCRRYLPEQIRFCPTPASSSSVRSIIVPSWLGGTVATSAIGDNETNRCGSKTPPRILRTGGTDNVELLSIRSHRAVSRSAQLLQTFGTGSALDCVHLTRQFQSGLTYSTVPSSRTNRFLTAVLVALLAAVVTRPGRFLMNTASFVEQSKWSILVGPRLAQEKACHVMECRTAQKATP